jgi:hypothetical protein
MPNDDVTTTAGFFTQPLSEPVLSSSTVWH